MGEEFFVKREISRFDAAVITFGASVLMLHSWNDFGFEAIDCSHIRSLGKARHGMDILGYAISHPEHLCHAKISFAKHRYLLYVPPPVKFCQFTNPSQRTTIALPYVYLPRSNMQDILNLVTSPASQLTTAPHHSPLSRPTIPFPPAHGH